MCQYPYIVFDRCSWRNLCCRCCHIQGDGGETVPAGCSCLVFDLLLCALLQGCLFIGLCASFLSCLLDFLPLVGLSKWFLAALINLLILVWEGHSSAFQGIQMVEGIVKKICPLALEEILLVLPFCWVVFFKYNVPMHLERLLYCWCLHC